MIPQLLQLGTRELPSCCSGKKKAANQSPLINQKTNKNQIGLNVYHNVIAPSFFIPNAPVLVKSTSISIYYFTAPGQCPYFDSGGYGRNDILFSLSSVPNSISVVIIGLFVHNCPWVGYVGDHCTMFRVDLYDCCLRFTGGECACYYCYH